MGTMKIANSLPPMARGLAMLALSVLFGGCTGLQPESAAPPSLHVLDARPTTVMATEKRDLVLEVSATRAWPGFDTPQMAYVKRPHELDYYASNRWADAPARMVGPLIARALEQSGGFRAIVQPPAVAPADLRLVSELIRLQQNFETRPSHIEFVLRVQLVDVRGKRVLATKTLEATETAASDDAYGGVAAANRALAGVLAEVAGFCIAESGKPGTPRVPAPLN
jgi:cholesterol transport system auxiliary component